MKKIIIPCLIFLFQWNANAQFFNKIKNERVASNPSVEWKNFGPGMSGYNEEFWCHPTDPNVLFMGPDMHVSYGSWDGGKSWKTIKDSDGDGLDLERVNDIVFSKNNPDFGLALERRGKVFKSLDRGKTWKLIYTITGNEKSPFNAHTKMAIHPTNDNIWFIGAGDFWNVKDNHRSEKDPHGKWNKIASFGYILKTSDGGASWKKIATDISKDLDVGRIIINPSSPDNMIIATSHGVFASTNGGSSWSPSNTGLPNNLPRDLSSYYNEKTKEFVLYLAEQTVYEDKGDTTAAKGGVYKSTDGGKTWVSITGNLDFDLNSINNPAEKERYYRTIGYWFGITPKEAKAKYPKLPTSTLPVYNRMVVNPTNKEEIYITFAKKHDFSFGPGDVWKTENGGKNWFVCARQGSYWLSNKDKDYWEKRNSPMGTNTRFAHLQNSMDSGQESSGNRMLAINSVGDVFIGIDQQTLRSTNHGKTWEQIDDNETSAGSNKWVGRGDSNLPGRFLLLETGIKGRRLLCSGEHGLWQTTDLDGWPDKQAVAVEQLEGQTQEKGKYEAAHTIATVAVNPKDPNTIFFLSTRQEHRGKLRKSTDGGKTWNDIATIFEASNRPHESLATQYSLLIDPLNPQNMYFCSIYNPVTEVSGGKGPDLTKGGYGFYRSFDGGYTWELSNNGFHEGFSVNRLALHPDNPEVIFAASNDNKGGLYKSTNKGGSWSKMDLPSEIKAVNNVFIDRNTKKIYIATGRKGGTYEEGGAWCSDNNGKSWKQIFKAPFVWQVETSPVNPDLIVVNAAGQGPVKASEFLNPGIYLSQNNGKTWDKINKGLGQPDKMVDVKPDPYNKDVLWCAGWGSGWFIAYLNGTKEGWLKN